MLLKVGTAMMLFAVAMTAVVALVMNLTGAGQKESSSEVAFSEPLSAQTTTQEEKKEEKKKEFDTGKKLEIDDEPAQIPLARENWPEPSGQELAATQAPRYYSPPLDSTLSLTVEAIDLYDVPVLNANTEEALDNGVIHFPQTPMPWEERQQKNVYLAGHRLGWPGTGSRLVFYNLDKLKEGDWVVLKDSLGTAYNYRVSEVFVVRPDADWAIDPVKNRDMVTLQTCTFPDLVNRLIVRADRA
jgi:LPXTG-site transpeptidase (sortase) family protein